MSQLEMKIDRAVVRAKETGRPFMVCLMDTDGEHDDRRDRVLKVYPHEYADDAEFEAFDGEVRAIAYPDGSVE